MMIPGASQVFFHSDGVPKTYLSCRKYSELAEFRPRQTPDIYVIAGNGLRKG
jgi:hypothetical protein